MAEKLQKVSEELSKPSQTIPKGKMTFSKGVIREFWLIGKKPLWYLLLGGLIIFILTPVFTYLYFIRDLGSKERIINRNNEGIVLVDRNNKPFFTFYEAHTKKAVAFAAIPQDTKDAVVSIEDKDFYKHQGIAVTSVVRALITNIEDQEITIGGSTITQQVIKNSLLTPDRNFLRKYQEAVLALEVDRRYTKNDILEMYLNTSYFGEGAFGIEDAAKAYFNKTASELTLAEGALLAGILPAPSAYSPISGDRDKAFERQRIVLDQMLKQGYITPEEATQAKEEEIIFKPQPKELNDTASHFALMVKKELIDKYGEQRIAQSGYMVQTTLDLANQEYAEGVVKNQVNRLAGNNATNGAVVVMDPKTGEILSLVGSHDWFDEENGKINMALHPRQPGSSFKPIIYADAFARHLMTPATELEDQPVTFPGGYKPRNYDGKFRGEVLARSALANSLNIPALHVMERVGVESGLEFAQKLGITTLSEERDYGLALVLGAGEVPLIEMTNAFTVFASGGFLYTPTIILEIRDRNERRIFGSSVERKRAIDPGVAFLISSILSDNNARQETFGNALTISRQAAVKTGTTEDYRDALTLGYTPNLVVGVWVGNNDNAPMDSVAGSLGAAPIWRLIMEQFFKSLPNERFTRPTSILQQAVCREDGLKALTATSSAYTEYFLRGTVPTRVCFGGSPTDAPSPTFQIPTDEPGENNDNPTPTNSPEVTIEPSPTNGIFPTDLPLPTL